MQPCGSSHAVHTGLTEPIFKPATGARADSRPLVGEPGGAFLLPLGNGRLWFTRRRPLDWADPDGEGDRSPRASHHAARPAGPWLPPLQRRRRTGRLVPQSTCQAAALASGLPQPAKRTAAGQHVAANRPSLACVDAARRPLLRPAHTVSGSAKAWRNKRPRRTAGAAQKPPRRFVRAAGGKWLRAAGEPPGATTSSRRIRLVCGGPVRPTAPPMEAPITPTGLAIEPAIAAQHGIKMG